MLSGGGTNYRDEDLPLYQRETTQPLQDYLMWQVAFSPFSDTDAAILRRLSMRQAPSRHPTVPLEDILESIDFNEVTIIEEVEAVLKCVQRFNPVGMASRIFAIAWKLRQLNFSRNPVTGGSQAYRRWILRLLAKYDFVCVDPRKLC